MSQCYVFMWHLISLQAIPQTVLWVFSMHSLCLKKKKSTGPSGPAIPQYVVISEC